MTLALRYAVRSDVGLIREGNEDSAYAGPHLLAIADGMGGHAAGEVASAVAITAIKPLDASTEGVDLLRALADAVTAASVRLREIVAEDPATEGMGTTLTALLWSGEDVGLCHIGDSRAYLLRDGSFYQITHDHTLVQSLVDDGRLTREAAASHPQRSLVMRALQSSVPPDPDLMMLQAQLGDRYLLCSDGLSDVVTDDTLCQTLTGLTDLDEAVERLIDLAIRSGGPDNITCVLADVVDDASGPLAPSTDPVIVGALAADAGLTPLRSDSPAARAHQLIHGQPRSAPQEASAGPIPEEDQDPGTENGYAMVSHRRRRRYPVVTLPLTAMLLILAGAASYTWHMTRDLYFVGVADGKVAVFRGLNDPVAGIHLSSVVRTTRIPVTAVPRAEADKITSTIQAASLDQAQQIVSRIQQGYQCQRANSALSQWIARQPKPDPSASGSGGKSPAAGQSSKPAGAGPSPSGPSPSGPSPSGSSPSGSSPSGSSPSGSSPSGSSPSGSSPSGSSGSGAGGSGGQAPGATPPKPVVPAYCAALTGVAG